MVSPQTAADQAGNVGAYPLHASDQSLDLAEVRSRRALARRAAAREPPASTVGAGQFKTKKRGTRGPLLIGACALPAARGRNAGGQAEAIRRIASNHAAVDRRGMRRVAMRTAWWRVALHLTG